MTIENSVPNSYWVEVVATTVSITNKCLTIVVHNITHNTRVYGVVKIFFHRRKTERSKLN